MTAATFLPEIVRQQKQGRPRAVTAACTANLFPIRAVLEQARQDGTVALIESTAGQVNPYGGYAGMTPHTFGRQVRELAASVGLPQDRLILGGDHIGPYPWCHQTAGEALPKASELAAACAAAGYRKIHLDTSPACRDDPREADGTLPLEWICRRSVDLCRAAEQTAREAGGPAPWYVIGSDVPPPGGADMQSESGAVSAARRVHAFVEACRQSFLKAGLADAWQRVYAVVVQTGAEFSPLTVEPYDAERMRPLVAYIRREDHLVFEAHSTDFQSPAALARMVADHCGILKVGPALTFAMREALFALADIEKTVLGRRKDVTVSRLPETMERLMVEDPRFWRAYYQGTAAEQKRLRRNAYSDRIRYYWARPAAQAALQRLTANLRQHPPPLSLLADRLPDAVRKIRAGGLVNDPERIVLDRVAAVLSIYAGACRSHPS
jgi:D-tagatose-1,6-bisphosphate aldolase subunit GatZ/KbaZ